MANQQVERIREERRLIALNPVADELKQPAHNEQRQRQRQLRRTTAGKSQSRGSDAVRQLVQRMPVLCFVVFNEGFGHLFFLLVLERLRLICGNRLWPSVPVCLHPGPLLCVSYLVDGFFQIPKCLRRTLQP